MLNDRVAAAILAAERPVCAYVYDRRALRDNARAVRRALPDGALLAYAMKANGNAEVVATLARECDAIEVASGGELADAVRAAAKLILFSGPAKTDADLAAAVDAGAIVNVESVHELRRLCALRRPARVALRVNRRHPALPGTHAMSGVPTAFGIDETQLAEAVRAVRDPVEVIGFHLHAVSNNLDAAAHAAFVLDAVGWARRAAGELGVRLELINVGGGFGVDYTGATRFDLAAFRRALHTDGRTDGGLVNAGLVFEPGRLLAASAGWYAAEVLDVKRTHGRWFAVVRGGTHHFRLPASWGYSHPFTVLAVPSWSYPFPRPGVTGAAVDLVGEQCNPRDVLARDAPVASIRAGDIVVLPNTGAYGWEVAHHDFLHHRHPQTLLL